MKTQADPTGRHCQAHCQGSGCNHQKTDESGSFSIGFFAGVVTGLAGMYLFGTDTGQKTWQSFKEYLQENWEDELTEFKGIKEELTQQIKDWPNNFDPSNLHKTQKEEAKIEKPKPTTSPQKLIAKKIDGKDKTDSNPFPKFSKKS